MKQKPSGKGDPMRTVLAWMFGLMFVISIAYSSVIDEELKPVNNNGGTFILLIMTTMITVGVFVGSIRHLQLFREKGFAVTALVFSSIFLLAVMGYWLGYVGL